MARCPGWQETNSALRVKMGEGLRSEGSCSREWGQSWSGSMEGPAEGGGITHLDVTVHAACVPKAARRWPDSCVRRKRGQRNLGS